MRQEADSLMRLASGTPTLESSTRLTVPERQELGRLARTRLPRSSLANYAPARDRPDPLALLESQAATRVAELVPIRYGRMMASPFSFYRGAALIMASDLATGPAYRTAGAAVRGRASVELRSLRLPGAQPRLRHRRLRRDTAGTLGVDIKRLLASLAVAGRSNGFDAPACEHGRSGRRRGLSPADASCSRRCVSSTCGTRTPSSTARSRPASTRLLGARFVAPRPRRGHADHLQAQAKLTHVVDGHRQLASDPPLLVPIHELVGDAEAIAHERQMSALMGTLCPEPGSPPAPIGQPFWLRRDGAQGRRGRQRRRPRLDRVVAGP